MSASSSIGSTYQYDEWGSTSGMASDVQGWLNTPSSNHGWLLKQDELSSATARRFTSGEGAAAQLPQLVITYTTGGSRAATPAKLLPGSLGLRLVRLADLDGDGHDDLIGAG